MKPLSHLLSIKKYELLNESVYEGKLPRVRDKTNGSNKLLKIVNVRELDIKVVDEVVLTMNKVNNMNIDGIMKYKIIENNENILYKVMREYKTHLDEIDTLKYFEESGPYEVLNGILIVLKCLNENGTIHSDLKPSNIFLNDENEVILSDYCNNMLFKGREGKKPERKREDLCFVCIDELLGKELDILSDIWNFGLIFYYIMSGKYPFFSSNMFQTMKNIENINYKPLQCEYNNELNSFLRKILVKEKKDRSELNKIIHELKKLNEPHLKVGVILLGENKKCYLSDEDEYTNNNNLGLSYYKMSKYEEAIPYYRKALEYSSSDEDKRINNRNLGNCYYFMSKYEEAILYFRKALEYSSSNEDKSDNYRNLGFSYYFMSKYEEANLYYRKALEYSSSDKNKSDNNRSIGNCYYIMSKYEEAILYFRKALEYSLSNEDKSDNNRNLGDCYSKMKQKAKAKEYYEIALKYLNDDDSQKRDKIFKLLKELNNL